VSLGYGGRGKSKKSASEEVERVRILEEEGNVQIQSLREVAAWELVKLREARLGVIHQIE
jgi:hypothetical protein